MRFTTALLALFAGATPVAFAGDRVLIDPVEFMVSWPDLVGRSDRR